MSCNEMHVISIEKNKFGDNIALIWEYRTILVHFQILGRNQFFFLLRGGN